MSNIFDEMSYKEKTLKTLLESIAKNTDAFYVITSGGTFIGRQLESSSRNVIKNLLILDETVFLPNSDKPAVHFSRITIFVDQIVAVQPISLDRYENLLNQYV